MRIESSTDLARFLPGDLPAPFSTADIALVAKLPRRVAQQMVYCLRATGAIEIDGKDGNSLLYRRSG
jgi:hypothetical protein